MKINFQTPISFRSIPLYDVKISQKRADGTLKPIDAKFSKLDGQDKDDISEAKKIIKNWDNTNYAASAANHFVFGAEGDDLDGYDYYVVEKFDDETGKRNIYSFAEFSKVDRTVEVIQANPKNKDNDVKGSGEVMLWGIAKYNRPRFDSVNFDLYSTNDASGFYKNVGLHEFFNLFQLSTDKTDEFLNRIEKKYHFDTEA